MTWTPLQSDLDWTRRMIMLLKDGGIWGCPAGFSSWIKVNDKVVTFDGPLNDGDTLPKEVPTEMITDAIMESCRNTNRRIIFCLHAIGVRVIGKDDVTITPDPEWSL